MIIQQMDFQGKIAFERCKQRMNMSEYNFSTWAS